MFCDVYCQLSKGSKENMPCYSKCKFRAAPWAPPSKSIPPPLKIMLWKSGRMLRLLHLQHYLGRKNTSGLGLGTPPEQEAWKSSAIPLQKFIIDLKSQGNNMESHGTASKHGWIFDPIGAKTWEGDPMEIVFWMNEAPPPAFASAAGFQTDFFFVLSVENAKLLKAKQLVKMRGLWGDFILTKRKREEVVKTSKCLCIIHCNVYKII